MVSGKDMAVAPLLDMAPGTDMASGVDMPSGGEMGLDLAMELDLAQEVDQEAVPMVCKKDEKVAAGVCVNCPAGTQNEAGDAVSGADTECEAILCAQNQRVQNNMCVACAPGATNDADDDASGADTDCDDACRDIFGLSCAELEQAYIKSSNSDANDSFGFSLALDGDTLVVSAPGEKSQARGIEGDQSDNSTLSSGAVYVFVRSGETWAQQAYIKASNTESLDGFGASVALAGDTLAVGANGEDSSATGIDGDQADNSASGSGAVYVFARSGVTWRQQAYLKSSNSEAGDQFGASISLQGNTLAVGARGEGSGVPGVDGDQSDNSAES